MIIKDLEPIPLGAYGAGKFLRAYLGGPSKSRKTASAMTLLNGRGGRVATDPKHLHILSFDPGALRTLEELKCPLDVSVYDLESLCNTEEQIATPQPGGRANTPFFDKLCAILDYLGPKIRALPKTEVSAIWFSGVAAMARGIQREIRYAFGKLAPDEMDQYRWAKLGIRCNMIMHKAHALPAHVIWEVNVTKKINAEGGMTDTQLLPGGFAGVLPSQCEQAVSMERSIGVPGQPGEAQFNTRPGWPWMQTSRMESRFNPMEPADWSVITKKAGYVLAEEKK